VSSHQNLEIAKARWLDFREFVCDAYLAIGFIARDARMAREAALAAFFSAPGGHIGADCWRGGCGCAIASNQSATFTRKSHLITVEKPLKNA
jgi:hypothetical protein